MKKINLLLPVVLMMGLTSCKAKSVYTQTNRVELDLNPSIELYVDKDNKVVSVSALNDDGSVLLSGEVMVGKTLEEASKTYIEEAKKLGYLVKDAIESSTNQISIVVDGASKDVKNLYNAAKGAINDYLTNNNIKADIEQGIAKSYAVIKEELVNISEYTKEQVNSFKESEVYQKISEVKKEANELITKELKEAYYQARNYKIEFANKEYTKEVINNISIIASAAYSTAVSSLGSAITALETVRFNNLISPNSNYQITMNSLRDAKEDILKDRYVKFSIADKDGNEYATATLNLTISEQAYNNLISVLEGYYNAANTLIDNAVASITVVFNSLKTYENAINNLASTLQGKANDLETHINEAKANMFSEFETAHKADIEALNNAIATHKAALEQEFSK